MRHARTLHFYEYLDRPYEAVRLRFAEGGIEALQHATSAAAMRAVELSDSLHTNVGFIEVGAPIEVRITSFEQTAPKDAFQSCSLRIEWTASKHPALFPAMTAEIEAHPVREGETQLALFGAYRPPLGVIGRGADALVGHRLAEASVHRFLRELVERLRIQIPV